ncbi:MAG: Na+/H+ antiporter subunit E [Robiginitomaculum sp.]
MFRFAVILSIVLGAYWLTLSGHFEPLFLFFGVVSILFTLGLVYRMRILDGETAPYMQLPKMLSYFVWLFWEIIKANIAVVKAVLRPDLEVSPAMIRVPAPQKTDLGKTMFANSITLTPGTVSIDMQENGEILVHALLSEMANPADFKEMGERSAWAVGEMEDEG